MKKLAFIASLLLAPLFSVAEDITTRYNPFTGRLDYITRLDSTTAITVGSITVPSFPPNECVETDTGGLFSTTGSACGAGGAGAANYSQAFVSSTSVVLTHGASTADIVVQCFDASSEPINIGWNDLTINGTSSATVTFASAQSGKCVVNTSGGGTGGSSQVHLGTGVVSGTTLSAAHYVSTVAYIDADNNWSATQTMVTSSVTISTAAIYTVDISSKVVWADGTISTTAVSGGGGGGGGGGGEFQVDLDTGVLDGTTLSYERLNSTVAATSKNQTWTSPQTDISSHTFNAITIDGVVSSLNAPMSIDIEGSTNGPSYVLGRSSFTIDPQVAGPTTSDYVFSNFGSAAARMEFQHFAPEGGYRVYVSSAGTGPNDWLFWMGNDTVAGTRVGIGTAIGRSTFTVFGNMIIGTGANWVSSSGVPAHPDGPLGPPQGLAVEGAVSIGTTSAQGYDLYVAQTNSGVSGGSVFASTGTISSMTVTDLRVSGLTGLKCVQTDSARNLISSGDACGGSGGGASTLAVWDGNTKVSSPTASIRFETNQFLVSLTGSATAEVAIDGSSVTMLGASPDLGLLSGELPYQVHLVTGTVGPLGWQVSLDTAVVDTLPGANMVSTAAFTDVDNEFSATQTLKSTLTVTGVSTGDFLNSEFDVTIGSNSYGIVSIGNGAAQFGVSNDGSIGSPGFDFTGWVLIRSTMSEKGYIYVDASNAIRYLIPPSGVDNATYNPRSQIHAGPAIFNDAIFTCSQWGFDDIDCDTSGTGADLGVQDDAEIGDDLFVDGDLTVKSTGTFMSSMTLSGNRPVRDVAPADNAILTWDSGASIWQPEAAAGGGDAVLANDQEFTGHNEFSGGITVSSLTAATVEVSSKVVWADGTISTTAVTGGGGGSDTNSIKLYSWSGNTTLATVPQVLEFDGIAASFQQDGSTGSVQGAAYDDSDDECRGVQIIVPNDVDTSGTATFYTTWFSSHQTSGSVQWYFAWNVANEGESWDAPLTEEDATSDAAQGTVDQLTETTWTESLSTLGWTANETVVGYFCRDGDGDKGTDDMTGDARAITFGIGVPRT